ncbi:DUF3613 domain-containing protein [Variovorax sp. Varisp85]|uniref:DUF3613 domain-containing protein n=1 Tax=Variovorax sp. Varisp85 TaxID=3243059 RepID=UPI0039A5D06D
MKNPFSRLRAAGPMVGLSLSLAAAIASAQNAPAQDDTAKAAPQAEAEYDEAPPLQVGDAATSLLARQRDGSFASPTARPIAGDVARRSYERYLKSFEYPIPERMSSTVKTGSSAGGSR